MPIKQRKSPARAVVLTERGGIRSVSSLVSITSMFLLFTLTTACMNHPDGIKRQKVKELKRYTSCRPQELVAYHNRLPGTKMKRQQTAVVRTRNITKTVIERLFSVLRTNGSLILLKSKNVYSLYPSRAMIGSSMYWCVKIK